MHTYRRTVQYYETDRMNFVHHSNYIRWFEEARVAYLSAAGLPYSDLEAAGYYSPVLEVSCQYRHPCTFGDTVAVTCALTAFERVRFTFCYRVTRVSDGLLLAEGSTRHCFMKPNGRPLSLERCDKALAARFVALAGQDAGAFDKDEK